MQRKYLALTFLSELTQLVTSQGNFITFSYRKSFKSYNNIEIAEKTCQVMTQPKSVFRIHSFGNKNILFVSEYYTS
jgi:hypothetical protein